MTERFDDLRRSIASLELDFHAMANSIPQLAWMTRPDGWIFWYNQRWFDYTGTTLEQMQGRGWTDVHHPDHVDRVVEQFDNSFKSGEPWEDLFPLRSKSGEYRWFLSRALPIRDEHGEIQRWFGTNTDVTEQKKTEERQSLLMREIDHRAKNALTVAQSVVSLTKADTVESYKAAVEGRIGALSRAHSLLAASRWDGADLKCLIAEEVDPFSDTYGDRVSYSGPSLMLEPAAAQSVGLIIHELVTNAVKHGALATPSGSLHISWKIVDHAIRIEWRESGAETVAEPSSAGFGTTLLDRLARDFMECEIERSWSEDGLTAVISLRRPKASLAASGPRPGPQRAQTESQSTNLPSVLIAEDEVLTAMDLEFRVSDAGYRVIGPASSVEEARSMIEYDLPKIALLDANLGGERSFKLAAELRAAGVEIVFCTGYEELEDLSESLRDCPIISKPFRDEDLLGALQSVRERLESVR
ncbi:MAG: HWE histidine kinase domain-containing protein [Henriciella sp.]|uniref:HWE histidine kinase domain-containing protein n=1 Tax=Henriciella sp. TaxID=1968823 RepID=UPI003C792C50